jgi:hypothetical protein
MDCAHHWKVASPNGAAAIGVCRRCGEERAFPTSSAVDVWSNDAGTTRRVKEAAAGARRPTENIRILRR